MSRNKIEGMCPHVLTNINYANINDKVVFLFFLKLTTHVVLILKALHLRPVNVVVQFYLWFNFSFIFFWGMYDIGSLKLLPTIKLNHDINMVQTFPYTGLF